MNYKLKSHFTKKILINEKQLKLTDVENFENWLLLIIQR